MVGQYVRDESLIEKKYPCRGKNKTYCTLSITLSEWLIDSKNRMYQLMIIHYFFLLDCGAVLGAAQRAGINR